MGRLFLARSAVQQSRVTRSGRYKYDSSVSMTLVKRGEKWIPAVDDHDDDPPVTKKADIERGEDQKSRWG